MRRARAGASNLPEENGGVIRRFTRSMTGLKTLAVVVAERHGRDVPAAAFGRDGAYIDFRGPAGTVPAGCRSADT